MPLTDTRIRNAKPTAKPYKLSDGGGMYLLVTPDGARYWRLDYRFAGKRRTLALGVYPIVTLASARTRREEARALLAQEHGPRRGKEGDKTCRQARDREYVRGRRARMDCQSAPQIGSAILVRSFSPGLRRNFPANWLTTYCRN